MTDRVDLSDHDLLIRVDTRLNNIERVVWGIMGTLGAGLVGIIVDVLVRSLSHGAG